MSRYLNWNFQRTGELKYVNPRHNSNEGKTLDTYRIKDYLEFYIDILECDYKNDSWKNYESLLDKSNEGNQLIM